jgi:GNAT superfamily N-acetyltransferase
MGNKFIRGARGRFIGSESGQGDIPTVSRLQKLFHVKPASDFDYAKANAKYEEWINALLPHATSNVFPRCIYTYSRLNNGNHCIVLNDPSSEGNASSSAYYEYSIPALGQVASLIWHRTTGEILGIGVEKAYQRKGLATELYGLALTLADSPAHLVAPVMSPTRTREGDDWAHSLGVSFPEENTFRTPEYWDLGELHD